MLPPVCVCVFVCVCVKEGRVGGMGKERAGREGVKKDEGKIDGGG